MLGGYVDRFSGVDQLPQLVSYRRVQWCESDRVGGVEREDAMCRRADQSPVGMSHDVPIGLNSGSETEVVVFRSVDVEADVGVVE